MIALGLHVLLVLAAAPLTTWGRATLAARFAGRETTNPPWRELRRLWRKPDGRASVSAIDIVPALSLAFTAVAAVLVPGFATGMVTAPLSDLLTVVLLLAAARTVESLAAIERSPTGGGPVASRAMLAWAASGPALLLVPLVLAGAAGSANLDAALSALRESPSPIRLPLVLAAAALALVGQADTAGDTVGEIGGPSGAILRAAAMLRLLVWLDLVASLVPPTSASWGVGAAVWVGKLVILVAALATADAWLVQPSHAVVPRGPALAGLLGLLAALLLAIGPGPA